MRQLIKTMMKYSSMPLAKSSFARKSKLFKKALVSLPALELQV